jgi:tetrahydromethanopterin S-methyltransferase subunit B
MAIAQVEGQDSLVKDTSTGVVSNTNKTEYLQFIRQRELAEKKQDEITNLQTEVADLKELVNKLLEKLDGK